MKVLIIRLSSIGDIVLTTPVIRCVKQQLADAEVHFLTKDTFSGLVVHNPYIDHIKCWTNDTKALVNELALENYDLVIDLHKNLRTRKLKKVLKITWISFDKLNIQKWLFVQFKLNLLPQIHIIDRYFDALKSLQVVDDQKGVDYFFSDNLSLQLSEYNLQPKAYVALAIGGTYFTKQIPLDVILNIIKRLNRPIVLLGGGSVDEAKAAQIVNAISHTSVIDLCNKLTLDESAYIIKNASDLITGDTGLMHIASAFETPIHCLWGNTHPSFGMYAYRTNKEELFNYQVDLKCSPCSKLGGDSCPRGHFECMLKQNIKQIVKNCQAVD
jgi:ADP-heptose:LPS heptosyltransferase